MAHTAECDKHRAEKQAERHAWVAKWPNYCRSCCGKGMVGMYSDYPEPCGGCTEEGNCARCGQPGLTSEERGDDSTGEGPCKSCGWDYKDGGKPDSGERCCICHQGVPW